MYSIMGSFVRMNHGAAGWLRIATNINSRPPQKGGMKPMQTNTGGFKMSATDIAFDEVGHAESCWGVQNVKEKKP